MDPSHSHPSLPSPSTLLNPYPWGEGGELKTSVLSLKSFQAEHFQLESFWSLFCSGCFCSDKFVFNIGGSPVCHPGGRGKASFRWGSSKFSSASLPLSHDSCALLDGGWVGVVMSCKVIFMYMYNPTFVMQGSDELWLSWGCDNLIDIGQP